MDHKNLVTFLSTKELSELEARWERFLSQYNFKIEYRLGAESGKPNAFTRRAEDLPTAGDKRLTSNVGILLRREKYWDISEEESKLEEIELGEFQDKDEGEIQGAYDKDDKIQTIKDNLKKGVKEMKGVELGLCQWKDKHLWYQEKILIASD